MKRHLFSATVFLLVIVLVSNFVFADTATKQVQSKVTKEIDLKSHFGDVDGCAVFYSNKENVYYIYNPDLAEVREIPCSTFKVITALAGLETGVIRDEHTVLRWDGVQRDFPMWNQDLSMMSAIQLSATWYFDEVTERVGMEKIDAILKELGYGNMDSSGGIHLWGSSLKISPMEQIDFIKKLFENTLPFQQKNLDIVKKAMYIDTEKGKLFGKTGTSGIGAITDGSQTAWFVGDYKTDTDEYYFAVRIYGGGDRKDIAGGNAQAITEKILEEVIYEGIQK